MTTPPVCSAPECNSGDEHKRPAERGAILILTAMVMIVLLLVAAFATDLGAWYRQGQEQQRAADVASLNGIQAYDTALKQYIEDNGATSFGGLTTAQQAEAEQEAMQAALDAITSALGSGGLGVSGTPTLMSATPPSDSTATVTADDGSLITITRDANDRIVVSVSQQGTQYFSNLVRDAPTIERTGSAVISNCNADCSRDIVIEPPFRGFDARGDGDGWAPLLRDDQEIWAVNHHSNYWGFAGSVICMDRDTEDFCNFSIAGAAKNGSIPLTGYQTANRPVELIDNTRDKIYFTARDISSSTSGLVCVDMAARNYCSTQYVSLWPQTTSGNPNAVGPVLYGNRLYVLGQNGELACVDPDTMATCGVSQTAAASDPNIPAMSVDGRINHMEIHGSRIYTNMVLQNSAGVLFECWDLSSMSSCWGSTPTTTVVGTGGDRFTFFAHNASGTPTAICNARKDGRNMCVTLTSGGTFENTALGGYLPALNVGWTGDAFSVVSGGEVRTFFGGGLANKTVCWDWKTNSGCGVHDHPTYTAETLPSEPDGAGRWPSIGGSAVEPYAYAQVTDECVVGLGDEAGFFTLTVDTLETCTSSSVSTDVYPCACGDGTYRYGVLELPAEMLAVLESAQATVSGGGVTETGDLMASPMDLSPFNGVDGPLTLTILVDSKIGSDGKLLWSEPYSASLALTVQPTLAN